MSTRSTPADVFGSRFRLRPIRVAEFSFLIFLLVAMGLPLLFLLAGSFNLAAPGKAGGLRPWQLAARVYRQRHADALWMSFLLSVVRLIPAMVLSVLFAWLIARTDMPGGNVIESFCWIAYFVPDFPLVLAWILSARSEFWLSQYARAPACRLSTARCSIPIAFGASSGCTLPPAAFGSR